MGASAFLKAIRRKVYGIAFLVIVAALIALTVGIYNKSSWLGYSFDKVTLEAKAAGNQLNLGGDVKYHGVLVGTIRSISVAPRGSGSYAKIQLDLSQSKAKRIPANVRARILPKTLFGEKFVDLVDVPQPTTDRLHDGSVITEDRSATAIETGKVFNDVLPLLRTLQPVKINATLNALATALEERGNALGGNAVLTDRYLSSFNPHLDTVNADISGLADLAANYDAAAPDLLRLLANSAASLRNVVTPRADQLVRFFEGTRGFANTTRKFVADNENRFIALAANSRPILGVLKKYSPEFPCLFRGLTDIQTRLEGTFATGPYLYVHLEIINRTGGAYTPIADNPKQSHLYQRLPGPQSCAGLPMPGVKFTYPHPGVSESTVRANEAALRTPAYGDIGPVGSRSEISIVDSLAGQLLGRPSVSVPDFTTLLLGPLLRGSAVSLR